jgi:hypothetical protein
METGTKKYSAFLRVGNILTEWRPSFYSGPHIVDSAFIGKDEVKMEIFP